jgi:hypothetical protein
LHKYYGANVENFVQNDEKKIAFFY